MSDERSEPAFDGSFRGTSRRQILLGLEMTPLERLRWLDRTMAGMRSLQGKAAPSPDEPPRTSS